MLLHENVDIPYVEQTLKEYQVELDQCFKMMKFWQRQSSLYLAFFLLFALLTGVTMILTKFGWLFWVLLGCSVFSAVYGVISSFKYDSYKCQHELWTRFIRPMEMTLARAKEARCNVNCELYEGNEK